MKNILIILMLVICAGVKAQINGVPIPNLPTQIGKPANAWLLISKGGPTTYKIDINDIASNKLDTVFVRNDSLYNVKNGVVSKGTPISSGVPSNYEDAFTGASNSYNTSHIPIAGTAKIFINGVKIPPETYTVSSNNVLINTALLSFSLSGQDRIDITYQSSFQSGLQ